MVKIHRPTKTKLTYFYTQDDNQLRKLLSELGLMSHGYLDPRHGAKGYFIAFNKRLDNEQIDYIKNNFNELKQPKNDKIITGFKGCLVTGINLEFK